jgi:hypothetical protein
MKNTSKNNLKNNLKLSTVYIISKGRPECRTAKTLTTVRYAGEWYIVCGNNDETLEQYISNWGKDRVIVFDWFKESQHTDFLDNFGVEKVSSGASPARNATMRISKKRGELRHWQFDDDYTGFYLKTKKGRSKKLSGRLLEKHLYRLAEFGYEADINNVGFAVGSDSFPDGMYQTTKRVFNAHNLTNSKKFVEWRGRMNDDLINALEVYKNGFYEVSVKYLTLVMRPTQADKGGNTDLYQDDGTVRKTSYAILIEPKATKLVIKFGRHHHEVNWRQITPKLLNEKHRKY